MNLQKLNVKIFMHQQNVDRRATTIIISRLFMCCLLAGLLGYKFIQAKPALADSPLVTQEIRYYAREADEVFLVWGIDNWNIVPETTQPPGTVIKDEVMQTPMTRQDDTFVVKVQVPAGATIDYGFLITRLRHGSAAGIWDARGEADDDYHIVAMPGGVSGASASLSPDQSAPAASLLDVAGYLLLGIVTIAGLGVLLYLVPLKNQQAIGAVVICLTLLGFGLRLWAAWHANQHLPDTPARLSSLELGYDELAISLGQGAFFQKLTASPLYPLFLAGCYLILGHSYAMILYVQALIGAAAIPLTFLLARHFTGPRLSLLATALIALHPGLILHVTRLSDEALFTFLFLLVMLSLLWALPQPTLRRFLLAGILLAMANLCRSTMVLFPLLLFLLLPRVWSFRNKAGFVLAYAGVILIISLPWSFYNFLAYGTFAPLMVSGASLWQGSPEFYYLIADKYPFSQIWSWYFNPEANGGYIPYAIASDRHFTDMALGSIKSGLDSYALYTFLKFPFFWVGHPAIDWPDYTFFDIQALRPYVSTPRLAGILATRLLPFVALIGLIILHEVHGRIQTVTPLLLICVYFMLIHAVTYPELRYSEPLHSMLAVIIAASIQPGGYLAVKPVLSRLHHRYIT